jgi:hypothetical protein
MRTYEPQMKETQPINFVLEVKLSGDPIPKEFGFSLFKEAMDAKVLWQYCKNARVRYIELKTQKSKKYAN